MRKSGNDQEISAPGLQMTPSMTGALRSLTVTVILLEGINFSVYHAGNSNKLMDSACAYYGKFTMRKRRQPETSVRGVLF